MIDINITKDLPADYVVFDLETTGLTKETDEIIEIGALKYHNDILVDTFSTFVKPQRSIPPIITNITGIANTDVLDAPVIDVALPKFQKFIANLPLIAHNASFDLGFLEENLKRLQLSPITNRCIDTLELARIYIPKAYNYKLETLKKYFKLEYNSHRSCEDCKTTNYVYQYCKNKALVGN